MVTVQSFTVSSEDDNMESNKSAKEASLRELIVDKASNTLMHGLPNMQRASSWYRKTFWLVLVLAGLSLMMWHVSQAVIKYRKHPTSTTIWYNTTGQLDFPAVTLCNLNAVRLSALYSDPELEELRDLVDQELQKRNNEDIGENGTQPAVWSGQAADEEEGGYSDQFSFSSDVMILTSELKRRKKLQIGHNLTSMLIECTYMGRKCNSRDFKEFSNYMYGNCYTFNSGGLNQTVKKTNKVGPMYGLSLELYVAQDEYIGGVSDAAGIRIVVHNQTYMPFPEDDGISISPGTQTTIGLKQQIKQRSIPPWGQCHHVNTTHNQHTNSFLFEMDNIEYTKQACLKTCYQKHLIRECQCYDPNFPYDRNNKIKAFTEFANENLYACTKYSINSEKYGCEMAIDKKFVNNTLECQEECPITCYETSYLYSASYATWPASANSRHMLEKLADSKDYFWNILEEMDWEENAMNTFVRKNFVKVDVYFAELTAEHIIVKPSYLTLDFISDLGGQAGLWVGVSMIALFELIELMLDICVVIAHRCRKK